MPPIFVAVTAAVTEREPARVSLNDSYLRALEGAGLAPVILSPGMTAETLRALLSVAWGLVLTGGGDVSPALYGEVRHETVLGVSEARDRMEFEAIRLADERELPVLAICRGMQVLNVQRGGSLIQDIPSCIPQAVAHSVQEPRCGPAHEVRVEPGTRLAKIAGEVTFAVNSRHHQALAKPGAGLEVTARAEDGVIEGVEVPGERFVVGVQWHPEDMAGQFASADRLFEAFAAACGTDC